MSFKLLFNNDGCAFVCGWVGVCLMVQYIHGTAISLVEIELPTKIRIWSLHHYGKKIGIQYQLTFFDITQKQ